MTGVLDAQFAVVFCRLHRPDEKPTNCQAVIPTTQLSVNEVWQNAVAMRGTGSHEVTATDLSVPEGLIMMPRAKRHIDRPLYRTGAYGVASAVNSAVPIGVLQAAVLSAGAVLKDRVSSIFGQTAPNSTAMLELMAEAWLSLEHLRLGTRAALDALWDYAERDEPAPASVRATAAGSPFQAVDVARDIISRLYARSSRAAFFAGHPLERALRDIHAIGYGLDVLRPLHHDTGRVALGLDPQTPGY
jgi:alkylation response protein AidB-like acyl-CoA dehydrogenase